MEFWFISNEEWRNIAQLLAGYSLYEYALYCPFVTHTITSDYNVAWRKFISQDAKTLYNANHESFACTIVLVYCIGINIEAYV